MFKKNRVCNRKARVANYSGGKLTLTQCQSKCQGDTKCNFFAYNPSSWWCLTYSACKIDGRYTHTGYTIYKKPSNKKSRYGEACKMPHFD